jgi:hypothetical protein
VLKYTVVRLGLFAVCFGIVWAVWLRGLDSDLGSLLRTYPDQMFWGLVIAAVSSMAVSFFALRGMREQISDGINARVNRRLSARAEAAGAPGTTGSKRRRAAVDEDADAEDAEADDGNG